MSNTQFGVLIGGIIPAILFGIAGFFQKVSATQNVSLGIHLVAIGIGVVAVGVGLYLANLEQDFSVLRLVPSMIIGASWGGGMVLVAMAISKYAAPLSLVVPIYNMNTLVTVILALIIFAEWKNTNLTKLLLGTLLMIAGGILVSGSANKEKVTSEKEQQASENHSSQQEPK
jgi:drug/metabolite transporter (DMT)-like permease